MGFNYFGYGNIHPCGVHDGYVYYTLPSGLVTKHSINLNIEIPEQTNCFISDTVAFLLYKNDRMYIGRFDTTYSVYRCSDGLLVGSGSWDSPIFPHVMNCGYTHKPGGGADGVYIDIRDKRTIYMPAQGKEGLLPKESDLQFDMDFALISVNAYVVMEDCHMFDSGGVYIGVTNWTVQNEVRCKTCPIFI